ncbi:hypothetical protein KI387_007348, partial [Taxus chinensis]
MGNKAFLVGCNYLGMAELKGCVNNVKRMYRCLIRHFGFEQQNIIVLIDTKETEIFTEIKGEPTKANIRRALKTLLDTTHPEDVLFFHYRGHDTRLPTEIGDQDDIGYDECFVPSDMNLIT